MAKVCLTCEMSIFLCIGKHYGSSVLKGDAIEKRLKISKLHDKLSPTPLLLGYCHLMFIVNYGLSTESEKQCGLKGSYLSSVGFPTHQNILLNQWVNHTEAPPFTLY